jgi:DNA-binding transcriptional MerR regulator
MEEAVILGQLIYWIDHMKDTNKYKLEEKGRIGNDLSDIGSFEYGWIYKSAEELAEEVMLGVSANTIRKYTGKLVDKGYIKRRNNPRYKWDKTFQYRVNLVKVILDLKNLGYSIDDYKLSLRTKENDVSSKQTISTNVGKIDTKLKNGVAIPEITTEITPNNTTETSSTSSWSGDDINIYNSNQFELIRSTYLSLSEKKQLSSGDQQAIKEVIKENLETYKVINWIKDCFDNFKTKNNSGEIRSFKYVANYILDQAYKDKQEVLEDEQNAGYIIQDKYFQRFSESISQNAGENNGGHR